jgi:hypothetical protein
MPKSHRPGTFYRGVRAQLTRTIRRTHGLSNPELARKNPYYRLTLAIVKSKSIINLATIIEEKLKHGEISPLTSLKIMETATRAIALEIANTQSIELLDHMYNQTLNTNLTLDEILAQKGRCITTKILLPDEATKSNIEISFIQGNPLVTIRNTPK